MDFMKKMENKIGRTYKVGHVFVKGKRVPFTELSSSPKSASYSDAKLVAEGEETSMKFTLPGT
jgi:hypothetical protein